MIKTLKSVWLPLAVASAVAVALVATVASAAVSSLGIGSGTTVPGGTVTVNVTAEATSPGIGAFTVDVVFDDLVTLTECTSSTGLCNAAYAANTARLVGASASGFSGSVVLGTLTFQAGQTEGTADLDVQISQLTDPEGEDISVTAGDGTITIAAPTPEPTPTPSPTPPPATATPTAAPTAAPTATPVALPPTGGEPSDGSTLSAWLLAVLGLAIVSGGVWAVARTRR
jgi:hypothetical protein